MRTILFQESVEYVTFYIFGQIFALQNKAQNSCYCLLVRFYEKYILLYSFKVNRPYRSHYHFHFFIGASP